jgi:predicted DNA repair protein MutK
MASSLLVLLDDIATVLDDVATMTKVAAKKTAGVLGDDLALNAQQVSGVNADRELPVVWAVAWSSMINKAILVPAALAISALAPWAITPLLMLGGAFLCFEGFEKLAHKYLHSAEHDEAHRAEHVKALADEKVDMATYERDKVKGAIRTDFILSAEIIVISLGTVAAAPLQQQLAVLVAVSIAMTVGVYGFVAGIVKMDDVGLWLSRKAGAVSQAVGRFLLAAAPRLMKALTVLGTAAMFLVGGGILAHGIAPLHHAIAHLAEGQAWLVSVLVENGANALVGVVAGALVLAGVTVVQKLRGR